MTSPALTDGRAELFRALGVLAEPPGPAHPRLADLLGLPAPGGSDWTEAFVVQLPPHASVYLGAEGMLGGEAADRVAGFWRALRFAVPADADHLAALLGLYATLMEAEQREPGGPRRVLWRQARTALLHEHLLSWLQPYTGAMADIGPPTYAQWADVLRDALLDEVRQVGAPQGLPQHLRDAPQLPRFDEGPDAFLDGLLAPARSGLLLTRAHLAAAARQSRLGLRLGERRRVLRALIEQDPAGMLDWLATHAQESSARHRADEPAAGPIARYWADRASAAAGALRAGAATIGEESRT